MDPHSAEERPNAESPKPDPPQPLGGPAKDPTSQGPGPWGGSPTPPQPRSGPSERPATPQVVGQPPLMMPPRRPSLLRSLLKLFLLGVAGLMLLMLVVGILGVGASSTQEVEEEHFSHERYSDNKVVIITLRGAILDGEGFVKRQIDQAKEDEEVKAVVLRIDSPGGTITGSDYLYHHLSKLRKEREIPIVVSMGGMAASGGYYVAMGAGPCEEGNIFAEPTTWTGSIGVIIPHYSLKGLMEKYGVEEDSVSSHELKTMGSFAKPIEGKELEIFQALVDEGFERFKDVIKENRAPFKKDPEAVDELATGQIYTAKQAMDNGLIDEIGFVEDAVDHAIALANLEKDDVCVMRYNREPTLVDVFLGASADKREPDLAALLEMTTPRAYYLCTRMPPMTSSQP